MPRLLVHIIGTGPVGLAYGHLLSQRGHEVLHTSPRGLLLDEMPVHAQSSAGTVHASYKPRFRAACVEPPAVDVNIFAVPEAACRLYLGDRSTVSASPSTRSLFFTSVYDPDAYQACLARHVAEFCLVYPLISCERSSDHGLNIVTDSAVEVYLPRPVPAAAGWSYEALFGELGLNATRHRDLSRLRLRYVQTAAVYVALRAMNMGLVGHVSESVTLVRRVFAELAAMAGLSGGDAQVDRSQDPGDHYSSLVKLLSAHDRNPAGNPMLHNIDFLLHAGQGKVATYLDVIKNPWLSYCSSFPITSGSQARQIISAVLTSC